MPHFIFNSEQGVRNMPIKPAETLEQARSHCLRLQAACSQHRGALAALPLGSTDRVFRKNPVNVVCFPLEYIPTLGKRPVSKRAVHLVFNSVSGSRDTCTAGTSMATPTPRRGICDGDQSLPNSPCVKGNT